MLNAGVTVGNS